MARRPEGDPLAGWWEFPGGKFEPGEGAAEAAVREIREELQCEIEPVETVCWYTLFSTNHLTMRQPFTLHFITARLGGGVLPDEAVSKLAFHERAEWWSHDELSRRVGEVLPGDAPFICELARHLKS